ncbi:MAG: aminopeptidase [Defluviitaleaceae bacterium]|nr:aminopeptidase [Defluviitaleaceae bacterium]
MNTIVKKETEKTLRNYANLVVKIGANVQKGQFVVITSKVDCAYFARMVQESAFDAGACDVAINWHDEKSARTKFLRADDEVFDEYPEWMVDRHKQWDEKGAVYISIISNDPDNFNGVDPSRLRRFSKLANSKNKAHSDLTMANKLRWTLCAVPSPEWAKKVFPELTEDEAMERLWDCIIKASRADGDDPVGEWKKHRESFVDRVRYLNEQQFDLIRFTNSLGTDITLGMPKDHVWKGGGSFDKDGIPFNPNIPTEEIFSAPDRMRVDGRVVASLPLAYQGKLVEGIDLTFENGKIVDFKASSNQETLANIIEMDEGSGRLGEVALVPSSSPINKMKTLFYNTLYDENASCHLAIGKAYPNSIKGGADLSSEELLNRGINTSLIHVDFMFGTADMKVVGIRADGSEVVIIEGGEYVF